MSDDLLRRARRLDTCIFPNERSKCLCGELADRIDMLEAALNRVVSLTDCWESSLISQVNEIAREALEGEDD